MQEAMLKQFNKELLRGYYRDKVAKAWKNENFFWLKKARIQSNKGFIDSLKNSKN